MALAIPHPIPSSALQLPAEPTLATPSGPLTADDITEEEFDTSNNDPDHVYAQYEHLRQQCPVARSFSLGGFWTLSRYADIKFAANRSDLFISSVKAVVPSDPRGLRRPPLNFDAPAHTPFRTALDRTLKASRLQRLRTRLVEHAERGVERLLERGGGDICCEFGSEYVAWVEVEWLNLDAEVAPVLMDSASKWVKAWRDLDSESVKKHSEIMYQIAIDVIADRRINPQDPEEDPASSLLLEKGPDGQPLPNEHLVGALRQSLVVGTVAPPIMLGSICRHLTRHPDLQRQLREDPDLLPAATEEFIRLYTPYRGFARTVSEPFEMHGRLIRPGEPVTMTYAAANRDPTVFPDPNEFILNRPNISSHLGFGNGRHRCAGMPLARMLLQTALEVLLRLTSDIQADGVASAAAMPELGATMCPVRLTRATS